MVLASGEAVPIETLAVGMSVLAVDPLADLLPTGHRILAVSHSTTTHVVGVTIRGADGSEGLLEATSEHPFWVLDAGWVAASALRAGDQLLDDSLEPVEVMAVHREPRPSDTFNLSVEGIHTFFVEAEGVRVLVHNQYVFPQSALYVRADGTRVDIEIPAQGSRVRDFFQARNAAGLTISGHTPPGYTWHHASFDPSTGRMRMQLVQRSVHRGRPHSGGVRQFRVATGIRYGAPNQAAVRYAQSRGWLLGRPPPPLPPVCP